MSNIDVTITDNTGEVLEALDDNMDRTLEALGLQIAGYAALNLERSPRRVDTGLLRNSITYAIAGQRPVKSTYQNNGKDKHGNTVPIVTGNYHGKMPKAIGEKAVYIGTNVQYSPYVHEGAHLPKGGSMEANRFLRDAVTDNTNEIEEIIDKGMRGKL